MMTLKRGSDVNSVAVRPFPGFDDTEEEDRSVRLEMWRRRRRGIKRRAQAIFDSITIVGINGDIDALVRSGANAITLVDPDEIRDSLAEVSSEGARYPIVDFHDPSEIEWNDSIAKARVLVREIGRQNAND